MLADHAPDLSTALERATAAGYTHLNGETREVGSGPALVAPRRPRMAGLGVVSSLFLPRVGG
ncbi:hypothetical protein GCM10010094_45830 [Streptomyces flaveus]|uniref:Uncharacterized protein n=1 Tax=Streptomyces flaveus TaxID=66370 RepID=A0A917R0B3_9ACTN|nr:hypothetical protein GCM10010094_45830 [Streptomyces flaveus]